MKKTAVGILAMLMALGAAPSKAVTESAAPLVVLDEYSVASIRTGAPSGTLKGIHFAESTYGANLNHPDPADKGPMGLHETEEIHKERARRYGEYDPCVLSDALYISGRLYMDNLRALGSDVKATAAHKQGATGVRRDGIDLGYVSKVTNGGYAND